MTGTDAVRSLSPQMPQVGLRNMSPLDTGSAISAPASQDPFAGEVVQHLSNSIFRGSTDSGNDVAISEDVSNIHPGETPVTALALEPPSLRSRTSLKSRRWKLVIDEGLIPKAQKKLAAPVASVKTVLGNSLVGLRGAATDVSEDSVDFYRRVKGKQQRCKNCERIPFNDALAATSSPDPPSEHVFIGTLERILSNRQWCPFCHLVFEALCQPENDPLLHPEIQNHIQVALRDCPFRQWADLATETKTRISNEEIWPFGHSRDIAEAEEEAEKFFDRLRETRKGNAQPQQEPPQKGSTSNGAFRKAASAVSSISRSGQTPVDALETVFGGATTGMSLLKILGASNEAGKGLSRVELSVIEAFDKTLLASLFLQSKKKKPLPCLVMVQLRTHTEPDAGLVVVNVAGRSRAFNSPLRLLSQFHLRVASKLSAATSHSTLRYGRILTHRIDLSLISTVMQDCLENHGEKCRRTQSFLQRSDIKGFRLIDVHRLSLCDSDPDEEFAALSYVWGKFEMTKLSEANKASFYRLHGLSPEAVLLPRTIRDAIKVTKDIGLNYLWVDALCIQQDNGEERASQVNQMDRIYSSALVTIVAGDGTNANSGLNGVSNDRCVRQIAKEVVPGINVLVPLPMRQNLDQWEGRAWTLQEKLLSNRLIVFGGLTSMRSTQPSLEPGSAAWHCHSVLAHEDMTAADACATQQLRDDASLLKSATAATDNPFLQNRPTTLVSISLTNLASDNSLRVLRPKAFADYVELISDYTRRRMSDPLDILRALQGFVPALELALGCRLHFGLPVDFLDIALLWKPTRSCVRRDGMPSWSWAGWLEQPKSADGTQGYGGAAVVYDEPYTVCTDGGGSLVKLIRSKQVSVQGGSESKEEEREEERIRPLFRWYTPDGSKSTTNEQSSELYQDLLRPPPPPPKWRSSPPAPNTASQRPPPPPPPPRGGNPPVKTMSLGLLTVWDKSAYQSKLDTSPQQYTLLDLRSDWEAARLPWKQNSISYTHKELRTIASHEHHLLFRTECAFLRTGTGDHRVERRKTSDGPQEETIITNERPILDAGGNEVGRVCLNYDHAVMPNDRCEFLVLSEAQFIGSEDRVDVVGYPLYNVMAVRQEKEQVRTRIGLGKIYKQYWRDANPEMQTVVLA